MTERPRKARKRTLSHGDLFHVYIASDTPPEVCAFLSELKQQGDFSYEVLQIIEAHVREKATTERFAFPSQQATNNEEASGVSPNGRRSPQEVNATAALYEGFSSVATAAASTFQQTKDEPPKADPIQQLRQQRKAWVANNTP